MNVDLVRFELAEALMHLQTLVAEFHEQRVQSDDPAALAMGLDHVLDHLCFAWNIRDMSPEAKSDLPQAEFERLTNTVPNFYGTRM